MLLHYRIVTQDLKEAIIYYFVNSVLKRLRHSRFEFKNHIASSLLS